MSTVAILAVAVGASFQTAGQTSSTESALAARAKAIHDRVIKLDTHNDIDPNYFTPECNYTMRLTTQVNLPKMIEGDMDVSFMIVYVGQGPLTPDGYNNAYKQAIAKFAAIHRLTEQIAPDKIRLALTSADVIKLHEKGFRIAVIGVENGYPIGLDLKRVKEFYDRGARYMSLAHNGNSQLSDSNTGESQGYLYHNGLSSLGREVIAEMNRLGMMIDVSHPSKGSMMETVKLSKAPIIASHSSVRALANVSRNMDDEQLLALKKNGGVIQMVALSAYLKSDPPERTAALAKLRDEFSVRGPRNAVVAPPQPRCPIEDTRNVSAARGGGTAVAGLDALSPARRAEYDKRVAEIDAKWPAAGPATVKDFVNHIDYAVKLIGIDHVGISSDFDGGGGIDGWNSAAEAFNVTLELVRRGYTEQQIAKLWGGNLLRVWSDVEKVARDLQKK
ncbi:MAG: membrane dipeptidase [Acidobacteria bacterium]|nr:MAG: membrane dipeptidase [Acidobacteriota bacterium]